MMKSFTRIMLTLVAALSIQKTNAAVKEVKLAVPDAGQILWQEQEKLMFVCLDPCTWQGREYDNHTTKLSDMKLPKLDTDQWCEAAVAWGAKQILFVTKHTGGFCWWQTETSEYSVKNIAWKDGKGCLLTELAKSCRKYDLNMGLYLYPGDDTWGAGIGSGGATRDPSKQEAYNKIFRQQLREICAITKKYVQITEFWFDGSCMIDVGDIMEEESPEAVILQGPYTNIRWVGTERGQLKNELSWCAVDKEDLNTGVSTSFHSKQTGTAWAPCEINTTLYDHHWFWSLAKEKKRKSLMELMRVYYESVGQGTVMLLNSTPNTDGLIPVDDMKIYKALGAEIKKRFGTPLATTKTAQADGSFILDFKKKTTVNHIIVGEDYTKGERISEYLVEGWNGSAWTKVTAGRHVGRKHINFFKDVTVSKLRLKVVKSIGTPLVTVFSAFKVTGPIPKLSSHTPWSMDKNGLKKMQHKMNNNWRNCGKWNKTAKPTQKITIDLTGKIIEAGQWQVKFTPDADGSKVEFKSAVLLQQGQPSIKGVLQQSKTVPGVWNISRTAVVTEGSEDIKLQVVLKNVTGSGNITYKRR